MKQGPIHNIWMLSREYGDLAGAGGVKDMVSQLAVTLAADSQRRVAVVLPRYGFIQPEQHGFAPLFDPSSPNRPLEFPIDMDYGREERRELCRVWVGRMANVTLYLIDADRFREKNSVYTYTEEETGAESWKKPGMGHYDYFAMNVLLQKSSLELMVILGERPDVIHCHDGHTALVPALAHEREGWRSYFRDTGCLVTIHNAGVGYHQEVADLPFARAITGLSWQHIVDHRLDGKFDPLLSAGSNAVMNTVSANYARELQKTSEDLRTDWLGHTLLERGVVLEGITNGIDPDQFNPRNSVRMGLPASYAPDSGSKRLDGKRECKVHLLRVLSAGVELIPVRQYGRLGENADEPLFTFIGRLSEQKGVDIFLEAIGDLFADGSVGQAVILGSGGEIQEASVISLTEKSGLSGRLCFLRGYSPELANLVYAAGDFFVIPSRFEPCGLTDYIAQLFGNIPVVHQVGGLVKVKDGVTGLAYSGGSASALKATLERAVELFQRPETMRRVQRQGVKTISRHHTWKVVIKEYLDLYGRAREQRSPA